MNKHCRILLVDDDREDQFIFSTAVNEIDNDIELKCVDNALHGLQMLQKNNSKRPDCIFLDLNLPYMNGFEFLQAIKDSKDLTNIPVIIFSTSSRDTDMIKARELGAIDFLSKPASYRELKDKINSLLSDVYCS